VPTLDVLTVSDMCVDLILTGNIRPQFHQIEQLIGDYFVELGGSANIFATQLAKLGARVGVIGWVGSDAFGQFVLEKLRSLGVDTSHVKTHPTLKTGLGVALTEPEDRAILTYLGTIDATHPEDFPEDPASICRHWHIASYFLLATLHHYWKEWISRSKQGGLTISLDTNWDPEDRWEGVLELLPMVDVFLPNEAEALRLTGQDDVRTAAERLGRLCPVVVIKRGDKGALAIKDGKFQELRPEDLQGQFVLSELLRTPEPLQPPESHELHRRLRHHLQTSLITPPLCLYEFGEMIRMVTLMIDPFIQTIDLTKISLGRPIRRGFEVKCTIAKDPVSPDIPQRVVVNAVIGPEHRVLEHE
jgi:sugar/nucleoside kinase (ribokinase family)